MKTKIYIHQDTNRATATLGASGALQKIEAKRGDTLTLDCVFHDGTAPVELSNGAAGVCTVKVKGSPETASLTGDNAWTAPEAAVNGYRFSFPLGGNALNTDLGNADGKTYALEITWVDADGTHTTQTIDLVLANDYWRDDEPEIAEPEIAYPLPGEIVTAATILAVIKALDFSTLPTVNPGGGRLWLNGGVPQVGA